MTVESLTRKALTVCSQGQKEVLVRRTMGRCFWISCGSLGHVCGEAVLLGAENVVSSKARGLTAKDGRTAIQLVLASSPRFSRMPQARTSRSNLKAAHPDRRTRGPVLGV